MSTQTTQLPKEYLDTMAHACLYSLITSKSSIGGDELFFAVRQFTQTHKNGPLLREFLGFRQPDKLAEYFTEKYDISQIIKFQWVHEQQLLLHEQVITIINSPSITHKNNLVSLFTAAVWSLSKELRDFIWRYKKAFGWWKKMSERLDQLMIVVNQTGIGLGEIIDILWEVGLQFHKNGGSDFSKVMIATNGQHDVHEAISQIISSLDESVEQSSHRSNVIENPLVEDSYDIDQNDEEHKAPTKNESEIITSTRDKKSDPKDKKLTIEYFGTNLTAQAQKGELDPVIGRDDIIDQMIYTLLRKTKNNPLLIGEPGVGKTAVVEWLAQRIVANAVPEKLKGKQIYMLDMGSLVAGTKYRGEFESRLKSLLEEAQDPTLNIILFIDELHTIIGAGGKDTDDAANLMKPLLGRGKIKVIGATTFDEYQKHIEKDGALKRRFQEMIVPEPNSADAIVILNGLQHKYEEFHGVAISASAIEKAVMLSQRYIVNKHLPDKAFDILDEACARKSTLIQKVERNDEFIALEQEIEKIWLKIEKAVGQQDYFLAADLKTQEAVIKNTMKSVRSQSLLPNHLRPQVTAEDIGQVIAEKMGIPATMINESELIKLKRLTVDLEESLLGQTQAIQAVTEAIQRSRLSPIMRKKPIASFLFLGASGVGKTYIAKLLAQHYFGDEKSLIRIDMSELSERHSWSKLIGSAPGYVGYEESGNLTEQVRRKPYSVVLFDEVEKASPDVRNILLQLLDEGQLKDNKGRLIDFKSTIIIMTSNIGSDLFSKKGNTIGFGHHTKDLGQFEHIQWRIMDRLKDTMSPELLNRIDHKIVFRPLSHETMANIFRNQVAEFLSAWSHHTELILPTFDDEEVQKIIEKIYDPQYGARPIGQYIHQHIEAQLIQQLMNTV